MLIKRFFIITLLGMAFGLSAQTLKPLTKEEFDYYEYQLRTGQADDYKTPSMNKNTWKDLLNDLITQVVEAKVPKSVKGWKGKGSSQVPSRNKIRLLAFRLRKLTADPELEEVSEHKLQWFKNIGNLFIKLEHYQNQMIRAVERGRETEYQKLYKNYMLYVGELKKLLDDRDKWKIPRKELNLIQRKNAAVRKKKKDELAKRYNYTRKLNKDKELQQKKEDRNRKIQERNNRRGARR